MTDENDLKKRTEKHLTRRRRARATGDNNNLRFTVLRLKQILDTLPDHLELEFSPISSAWLGTMRPMRAKDIEYFHGVTGDYVLPTDAGAYGVIYLHEESEGPDDDE